ncbi:MAG: hypothetical protein Q8L14_21295 [Myxococcales bacterium]|nr:hypothetical protein [Myxococcales bacterium]
MSRPTLEAPLEAAYGAQMRAWQASVVLVFTLARCSCAVPDVPPSERDAGHSSDAAVPLADAGAPDSDAGIDGGHDAGLLLTCELLVCPPWQRCVEASASARCVESLSIAWVSPIPSASAPADLVSIPIAIETDAPAELDVPWTSSGAITSAGVFSGQIGVRAATLFLSDTDGGEVVLTAGWSGGPLAVTRFTLAPPIVRPGPVPSYGTNGPDFEPNDPAGLAFRRDETVPIELGDFPQPMAVFARVDQPTARTLGLAVTHRSDGGGSWRIDLPLRELQFPAFRAPVFVWATGTDGGVQTRPRSVPVTRWRWRRQVSAVPNPISVTRPAVGTWGVFTIGVGSADGPTDGRFVNLGASGNIRPLQQWPASGAFIALTGAAPAMVGLNDSSGGAYLALYAPPDIQVRRSTGSPRACSTASTMTICANNFGWLNLEGFLGRADFFSGCPSPPTAISVYIEGTVLFGSGEQICFMDIRGRPPTARPVSLTQNLYRPRFARDVGEDPRYFVAGADGGVWLVGRDAGVVEFELWGGGLVDGISICERRDAAQRGTKWSYWVTSDRRVHGAAVDTSDGGISFAAPISSSQLLPAESSTTPVIAQPTAPSGLQGSLLVVSRTGAVSSFDLATLRTDWTLAAGDGGIRGGRVDTEPIGSTYCGHFGSLLVPSSGDGSLYSLILDGTSFAWEDQLEPWAMEGRTPQHNEVNNGNVPCTAD